MPKITYIDNNGNSKTINVENGLSVMEGAIQNDIQGIDADCGGSMACATCHVYVEEKWLNKIPKAEEAEVDMIDMAHEPKKNSRLSCQLIVSDELDGLIVTTPEKQSVILFCCLKILFLIGTTSNNFWHNETILPMSLLFNTPIWNFCL